MWPKFFNLAHKFFMMFRSGYCAGKSLKRHTSWFSKNVIVDLDLWHGAPSCINIELLFNSGSNVVRNIFWYISEFKMLGHMHNIFVQSPFMALHTITPKPPLTTVLVTNLFRYLCPMRRLTNILLLEYCSKSDSSEKVIFSHDFTSHIW